MLCELCSIDGVKHTCSKCEKRVCSGCYIHSLGVCVNCGPRKAYK